MYYRCTVFCNLVIRLPLMMTVLHSTMIGTRKETVIALFKAQVYSGVWAELLRA